MNSDSHDDTDIRTEAPPGRVAVRKEADTIILYDPENDEAWIRSSVAVELSDPS